MTTQNLSELQDNGKKLLGLNCLSQLFKRNFVGWLFIASSMFNLEIVPFTSLNCLDEGVNSCLWLYYCATWDLALWEETIPLTIAALHEERYLVLCYFEYISWTFECGAVIFTECQAVLYHWMLGWNVALNARL